MKAQVLFCLVVLGLLSAVKNADAKTVVRRGRIAAGKPGLPVSAHSRSAALDSVTRLLRLKLYLGPYDYDDIAIGFNAGASPSYNPNEDSKYMPGMGAAEGLASLSSDGVELSVNFLPLPNQTADTIRLDVEAQNSGPITLERTELDSLPKLYRLLLVDKYKKDTLDLRTDSAYVFNINKADTNTYGTSRFEVIVYQDPAQQVHLVSFNAEKISDAAQVSWTTQNEENYTHFAVERSSDGGATFSVLDSLISTGLGNYNFTDKTPPQTSDGYRLRMTDMNGTISYSNTVSLSFADDSTQAAASAINLYPNPTNGIINLSIAAGNRLPQLVVQTIGAPVKSSKSGTYSIHIVNISGMTVKTSASLGNTWQDNLSGLTPGTYVITVVENSSNKILGRSTFVKL